MDRGVPSIFATNSGRPLAERIIREFNELLRERQQENRDGPRRYKAPKSLWESHRLGLFPQSVQLGKLEIVQFGEGEFRIDLDESVRDRDVFLIQSPYEPPQSKEEEQLVPYRLSANVMEGIVFADMLKSRFASSVVLISPYLPYARQDHTTERQSLTAATYAKQLHATGLRSLVTVEVHSKQQVLAYEPLNIGFDNLRTGDIFIDAIAREYDFQVCAPKENCDPEETPNLVVVSPDGGGVKRARYFAKRFGVDVVWGDKRRDYTRASKVKSVHLSGPDVTGMEKVVVDDMVASGGSMCAVVDKLFELDGKSITLVATHPLLTGQAVDRFDKLHEEEKLRTFLTMDTVMRPESFAKEHPWYREISCADIIAQTIYAMNMSLSVSNVYEKPC